LNRDVVPPDKPTGPVAYQLDLDATETAGWVVEVARRTGTRYQWSSAGAFAELVVERPEAWAEHGVADASGMVDWLTITERLNVARVEETSLGGREATAVEARPIAPSDARPGSWESHFWNPTGNLMLDVGWRYRFIVVDLGEGGWLVATCGGDAPGWAKASQACGDLLATWEWVEA
jgi:hypothetical protein